MPRHSKVQLLEVVAGLAQSVERKALNLVVVGSSPTPGVPFFLYFFFFKFCTGPRVFVSCIVSG